MRERDLALLEGAAQYKNRERVIRLNVQGGEILHAKIIGLPCDCGTCTDTNVLFELVWSSSEETRSKWDQQRREKNVGGWGIPIELIESVEVPPVEQETK